MMSRTRALEAVKPCEPEDAHGGSRWEQDTSGIKSTSTVLDIQAESTPDLSISAASMCRDCKLVRWDTIVRKMKSK